MRFWILPTAAVVLAITAISPTWGALHVKHDSAAVEPDGLTWETAYTAIQPAIDHAAAGDEVRVAGGVYIGKIILKGGVTLKGGYAGVGGARNTDSHPTVIDAANDRAASYAITGAEGALVDGFTIRGAWAGVYAFNCSPVISNNKIIGNRQAGVWLAATNASVTGNLIQGSSYGVVCWSPGSPTIDGNIIRFNERGVGCHNSASPIISNNAISSSAITGIYCESSSPQIVRNKIWANNLYGLWIVSCSPTITGNSVTVNGISGLSLSASSSIISGNVIAGNTSAGIACTVSSAPTIVNNTIAANGGGIGCYSYSSPSIYNNIIAFNQWGIFNTTPGASNPDLRANCVYGNRPYDYTGVSAGEGDISADPLFASLIYADFHIAPDSPCRDSGAAAIPGLPAVDFDGRPRPEGSSVDIGAYESYGEIHEPAPRIVYVNAAASPGGDGKSWHTAFRTIQEGVGDVVEGPAAVWVAKGTYVEQVKMRTFASIFGGFAGTEDSFADRDRENKYTIIDANNRANGSHVLTGASASAIDGFIIRGGYHGIRAFNRSPIITNNKIVDNADHGILCTDSSPIIANCVVSGNGADGICVTGGWSRISHNSIWENGFHGVEALSSVADVINNLIVDNGAAAFTGINCLSTLTNNTIMGNDGGLLCFGGATRVSNNIITHNVTGVYWDGGGMWFSRNNVYGSGHADYYPSTLNRPNDISFDPQFADADAGDFRLLPSSPCVNAGDSSAPLMPDFDLDGEERIISGTVDIGAYELRSMSVVIDIKPGEFPNTINLKSRGLVPVAILTTPDFNALHVDLTTVRLAGCPVARRANDRKLMAEFVDVDRDGDLDLVVHFETQNLPLAGATSATLTGMTRESVYFEGSDGVVVVGK